MQELSYEALCKHFPDFNSREEVSEITLDIQSIVMTDIADEAKEEKYAALVEKYKRLK